MASMHELKSIASKGWRDFTERDYQIITHGTAAELLQVIQLAQQQTPPNSEVIAITGAAAIFAAQTTDEQNVRLFNLAATTAYPEKRTGDTV